MLTDRDARASHRRCAVLGSPIAHSLSPVLHRAAYRELGLAWEYDAVEMTPERLGEFVHGLDATWRGLSLTMPLKRAVLPLLDTASDTVVATGVANTVVLEDDGRRAGHNTDVPGLRDALRERGVTRVDDALVVGGGATATSAVLALSAMGCRRLTLLVREPERARPTLQAAERLPEAPRVRVARLDALRDELDLGGQVDVVVSTVPAAAQPELAASLVQRSAVVFDVVYDPWPTPLGRAALDAGRLVVNGLDLLAHQATGQVELMTGCARAPLAAMRSAGEAALARSSTGGG